MLSGELASQLSGRYIEFPIHSLSYTEFLKFHKQEDSEKSFNKYATYGGLPYLIHLELKDEIVFEYLKSIYSTIIYHDVIRRYSIRNIQFLERLTQFIADNIGSLFSAKKISDYLKSQKVNINTNLTLSYLNSLTSAFIIHQVNRYDIVGKRIFEIGNKFYFENLGIRNSLVGYKPQDQGKILENIVYNHLLYLGYHIEIGVLGSKGIDFICTKNQEKLYVQVALHLNDQETILREFGNLREINDNYPKLVVSTDDNFKTSYEGVSHLRIRDFLLKEDF